MYRTMQFLDLSFLLTRTFSLNFKDHTSLKQGQLRKKSRGNKNFRRSVAQKTFGLHPKILITYPLLFLALNVDSKYGVKEEKD